MSNVPSWLNYHHLLYFWTAAREGGITQAATKLRLSHPTVSAQIRSLEEMLGEKLFRKEGRHLALTETGRVVYRYADEIFKLGTEMVSVVTGRGGGIPLRLNVGVADVVPKLIARRLLVPAQRVAGPVRLVCTEDTPERLLAELAVHAIDVVISDAPVGPGVSVRAFNHLLGECGVSWFGTPELARKYRRDFPRCLDQAPVLLPTENTTLRRSLDQWFEANAIHPKIIAEFEDSALLKAFGQDGEGLFPGPSAIAEEIERQYRVVAVGSCDVRERFYAITVERRIRHPAVAAIYEVARRDVFG